MESAIESAQGNSTQRAWQTLPRSLRRRAASHDVRRVPVRLREKAKAEVRNRIVCCDVWVRYIVDGPCKTQGDRKKAT